ncbi:binding-protein-dependent transport systems inner membrane component [Clostridium sp. CAG:1013]|jgi:arabinosaccharide transport system permease protein|nr:binding-protein-dependent transport systems inner membrane component [Clostridium sp. CAG:1013]
MIRKFFYNQKVAPYMFILPFLIIFCLFFIYPMISTIVMSFQDVKPGVTEWVGLANFQRLFGDKVFFKALSNSVLYMILTLVLLIPFPMMFACMINSKLMKAPGLFKSLMYLPAITSVVVAGTIFRLAFSETEFSLMNQIVAVFGIEPVRWLRQQGTGFFVLLLVACWRWTGVNMMYFLSGLKSIPEELYESASIDGANGWQKFTKITMPLLKPTTIYVLTISIYAGLAMFTESFILWNGNSSPNNITLTIVGYLYRQGIEKNDLGYASTVGLVLLIIAMTINLIQLRINGTLGGEED